MGPRWRKTKGLTLYAWIVCLPKKHMETVSGWVDVNMAFGMGDWARSGSSLLTDWCYRNKWGAASEVKRPKCREEKEKVGKGRRRISCKRGAEDSKERKGSSQVPGPGNWPQSQTRAFAGDLVNSSASGTVGQKPDGAKLRENGEAEAKWWVEVIYSRNSLYALGQPN